MLESSSYSELCCASCARVRGGEAVETRKNGFAGGPVIGRGVWTLPSPPPPPAPAITKPPPKEEEQHEEEQERRELS